MCLLLSNCIDKYIPAKVILLQFNFNKKSICSYLISEWLTYSKPFSQASNYFGGNHCQTSLASANIWARTHKKYNDLFIAICYIETTENLASRSIMK